MGSVGPSDKQYNDSVRDYLEKMHETSVLTCLLLKQCSLLVNRQFRHCLIKLVD